MENKCPKCGKKLSVFYIKETCSDCGCNLMYYNMEKRLAEDEAKAEAEYKKLDDFITKVKSKFQKNKQEVVE